MAEDSKMVLAARLASLYSRFPQVEAAAVSGSLTSGTPADASSDIDLYVYTTAAIPLEQREELVRAAGGASRADMNLDYWDLGDEWFHAGSGIEVDVMYWDTGWVEEALRQVVFEHRASLGYTTAHWHTVQNSKPLFDRRGWFAGLQTQMRIDYPENLRRNILSRNHRVLRRVIPAYFHQVDKAAARGDLVSVNHRVASLLASYFDIIFAANRVLHPGEKRLLEQAERLCPNLPRAMRKQVESVLLAAGMPGGAVTGHLRLLLDDLDAWLRQENGWLFEEDP
jgi:hypothetical protein